TYSSAFGVVVPTPTLPPLGWRFTKLVARVPLLVPCSVKSSLAPEPPLIVALLPRVRVVVEDIANDAAVVNVASEEAVTVLVPESVVVVLVRVVVAPRLILDVAPESRISLPVTCKSS